MRQISQSLLFALTIFFLEVFPSQATLSVTCDKETSALRENATLKELQVVVYASVHADLNACSKRFVTVFEKEHNLNFTVACNATGGKILSHNLTFNCSDGRKEYSTYDLRFIKDDAICVSNKCNASEEMEILVNFSGYRYPFTASTTDASTAVVSSCTLIEETSGSSHCDAYFGLIIFLFSSLLGFLFY